MAKPSKIQELVDTCHEFVNSNFDDAILKKLVNLVEHLSSKDLNFSIGNYRMQEKTSILAIPVHYDQFCTVMIYILKSNVSIPVHDHPNMYSFVKTLDGKLKTVAYRYMSLEVVDKNMAIKVREKHHRVIGPLEKCHVINPDDNFHSITAFGGTAGYLDILCPPYSQDSRPRSEYEIVRTNQHFVNEEFVYLKKCQPKMMVSEEGIYRGPKVVVQESQKGFSNGVLEEGANNNDDKPRSANKNSRGLTVVCPKCDNELKLSIR